jgi:hypothetical protein
MGTPTLLEPIDRTLIKQRKLWIDRAIVGKALPTVQSHSSILYCKTKTFLNFDFHLIAAVVSMSRSCREISLASIYS